MASKPDIDGAKRPKKREKKVSPNPKASHRGPKPVMGMLKPFVDMVRGIGPNKQNHTTEHKEPAIPEDHPKKQRLGEETLPLSIPLVTHSQHSKSIVVNQEAVKLLNTITKPVAVLSICGPYRTGKSYFVSQVLGGDDFKVSHFSDPCTRGIWMSTNVLEYDDHVLILLDTEGIGAAQESESSSTEDVLSILILVTLLSSCLIYNTKGAPMETDVEQMSCFATLSQSVLISESLQHDDLHKSDLKKHFPHFLWLMRDFDLKCKDDKGKQMSVTDYVLQKILVTKNKGDQSLSTRDRAVGSVRAIFPQIKCLDIPSPGAGISNPEKKHLIDPDFHTSIDSAKTYVISNTPVKRGFNGSTGLNGSMLATLLHEYVEALNKPGTIPNLEVSYQKVVEVTLTEISQNLAEKYHKRMSELLNQKLPLEEGDIETLKQTHSVRIEESLNGDILKMHQDTIKTVKKTDTLFEVHERVYTNLLREFTIELHRLIPEAADTDETLRKDEQTRKSQLLEKFEKPMFRVDTTSNVLEGYISHFTQSNTVKSESTCKEVFATIYKQQIQTGAPEREKLKAKYHDQAVGPAKDHVFQKLISQIPGPPQNVAMNLDKQILSWDKPLVSIGDVSCYHIEWYREGEDPEHDKICTNHFKFKMLKPKTNYFIKVRGFNDHTNRFGENCPVVTFQTRAGKPEKPKMPTANPQTEETVKLTVTMLSDAQQNGSPVTDIIISRRTDKKPNWEPQKFLVDSSQGEFQTLVIRVNCNDNEEKLYFRVQFENKIGVSESSDPAELYIANMIPGKPENITTIAVAREVQLTWDSPINNPGAVNSYQLQYWEKRDSPIQSNKSEKTARHDERSLQLTSLRPFTQYTFRLYARNEKNRTADGYNTVDVQTLADVPDKPHTPTIRVISASKATITFTRQNPNEENGSPVNKIAVERQIKKTEHTTKWTALKEHPLIDSESDIQNVELINFTEHAISCYRVVTINSIGRSEPSQAVEVHPENIFPGSPEGLKAVTTKCNSIKVSWSEPTVNPIATKQYQIKYKKFEADRWTHMTTDPDSCSCTVSELRPYTKYIFNVQAFNESLIYMSENASICETTLPSEPPRPRPPIVIPSERKFTLTAHLPSIEESGKEITQLRVNYYSSYDRLKVPEDIEVIKIKQKEDNTHKQQIKVNIDKTCWISINLINEIGISEESEIVPIAQGGVTPGKPNTLECIPEARSVKLSWNVPQKNGNAAKYYKISIYNNEEQDWTKLQNVLVNQKMLNDILSYEAIVNSLSPSTRYRFSVQAVNNTSGKICVGDRVIIEKTTIGSPPDKPDMPIAVEPIMGKLFAKLELKTLSNKQMNESPVDTVIVECECNEETKREDFKLTAEQQIENTDVKLKIVLPNLEDPTIKKYLFRIKMRNKIGESPPSDAFELPVSKLPLGLPKNIQISETAHTLQVRWEAPIHPALVTHYDIEIKGSEHTETISIPVQRDEKEYCRPIYKLRSDQKYRIKVIAVREEQSKGIEQITKTTEIYPGPPSFLFEDKINTNCVKVRWGKPKHNSKEVHFYKVTLKDTKANKVIQVRNTLGHSTVFKNLSSSTNYTASIDSYNDNKKKVKNATLHVSVKTKMWTGVRVALQVLTAPTMAGPAIIGDLQKCDENIYPSDDEFEDDTLICPSAPKELAGKIIDTFWKKTLQVTWELPEENIEELDYFEVQVIEEGGSKEETSDSIKSYGTSEMFKIDGSTKQCKVTVTPFNYSGRNGRNAVKTIIV